jgi:hypothetical protein
MPRKAPEDSGEGKVIHATSAFKPGIAKDYAEQYEDEQAAIDGIMTAAAKKAQPKRDNQKEIVKRAAEDGIPKKEFRALLRWRRLLSKADAVAYELDDDQQETFTNLKQAAPWHSTPLGEAAEAATN